jgi:hypothetical protein
LDGVTQSSPAAFVLAASECFFLLTRTDEPAREISKSIMSPRRANIHHPNIRLTKRADFSALPVRKSKTQSHETNETHVPDEANVTHGTDGSAGRWWPEEVGESPNSSGGQNEMRYAFFGDKQRLAVDRGDGKVQLYDTGDHRISGVQQHQRGSGREMTFTSQHGEVALATLKPV